MAEGKVGCLGNMADLSAIWCCARQMTLSFVYFLFRQHFSAAAHSIFLREVEKNSPKR